MLLPESSFKAEARLAAEKSPLALPDFTAGGGSGVEAVTGGRLGVCWAMEPKKGGSAKMFSGGELVSCAPRGASLVCLHSTGILPYSNRNCRGESAKLHSEHRYRYTMYRHFSEDLRAGALGAGR